MSGTALVDSRTALNVLAHRHPLASKGRLALLSGKHEAQDVRDVHLPSKM